MITFGKRLFAVLTVATCVATAERVPPVGFVVHEFEGYLDELDPYGISAEISNVFVWRLKSKDPLQADFEIPAQWLQRIHSSEHTAYPIIDTSVFHSGGWRGEEAEKLGQQMCGPNRKTYINNGTKYASLFSPFFRKTVFDYTDQLVNWIVKNDPQHRIPAYMNGAEWFMPGMVDYSPLAIAEFQGWLKNKYGGLDVLNEQWGGRFKIWDEVTPPFGFLLGDYYSGMRSIGFSGAGTCLYESPAFSVEPGQEYWINVEVTQKDVPTGLCGVKLMCFDRAGKEIKHIDDGQFYWTDPDLLSERIESFCKVPDYAATARLQLKLMGPGEVSFSKPQVRTLADSANLVPEKSADWTFSVKGLSDDQYTTRTGLDRYTISIKAFEPPYKHTGLAWDDWITFCYESMADWLNVCAEYMKQKDPSRDVLSYVGSVFGTATLGDFAMYWQRLDISLANSPAIDINGIQVCIGDHDYTMTTTPVDIARKYNKPIYLSDFVDFPYGLWSGFNAVYRGVMTAIQHGADGTFPYAWADTHAGTDYQYFKQTSPFQLKKFVADQFKALDAVKDCEVYTETAFILPVMPYSVADQGGYKSDLLDIGGWCQLLNDAGILADFYTPYELANRDWDLSRYKTVILPDCPVLPAEAHEKLVEYVRQGGTLIGAGRSPSTDLRDQPLKNQLLRSRSMLTFKADAYETQKLTGEDISVAENILSAAESPRAENIGKGQVFWMDEKIGKAYWGHVRRGRPYGNTPAVYLRPVYTPVAEQMRKELKQTLHRLIASTVSNPLIQLSPDCEDAGVVLLAEGKPGSGKTVLFVINQKKGRHHPVTLLLDRSLAGLSGTVQVDFDRITDIAVEYTGRLELPDFSDTVVAVFNSSDNSSGK